MFRVLVHSYQTVTHRNTLRPFIYLNSYGTGHTWPCNFLSPICSIIYQPPKPSVGVYSLCHIIVNYCQLPLELRLKISTTGNCIVLSEIFQITCCDLQGLNIISNIYELDYIQGRYFISLFISHIYVKPYDLYQSGNM